MNEKDLKIRKQWLIVLLLSTIWTLSTKTLLEMHNPLVLVAPRAHYVLAAFSLLAYFLLTYVNYYCAYKKRGTKWLTFCLITTALSLITTPIFYWKGILQGPTYFPYFGAYTIGAQIVGILWFIACWRLRKVNKKLRSPSSELATS